MIRKLSIIIILVLFVSLFVAIPVSAAKSYYAERFDVLIDLQENGSAIVTETVEFHFSGGPFTFAFREISATETDGITFLDARMDGVPMPQGTQAGEVEVKARDPLKVTWHFPPTSDSTHIFTVQYRAEGVIRKGDADTLIWRAIPEDHDYSITKSTIILTYPPKATLLEQPTLDWNYDSKWEENRLTLTASGLAEDEDLILTAHFSPSSLTEAAPRWQVQKEQAGAATAKALPFGILAGLTTLVFGGVGLFTYVRANGRELNISPTVPTANPPSDVSPAIIGKLTGQHHSFMGAIFDLAQRGVLEMREEKGFWGMQNYMLVHKDQAVILKPHEQGLLDALFEPGETQINLSEVPTQLAKKNKLFEEPLENELIQRGWLDSERKQKRTWLATSGLLMIILAMIAFILSLIGAGMSLAEHSSWLPLLVALAGVSAGLFILSVLWLIYGATFSTLTPAGEEQSARWKGFAEYLKQVSKGREPAIGPDTFEKYLAYAAVFGLGGGWAKYFQQRGGVSLPTWFHAMAGNEGDFGAMVVIMSASDSAGASAGADGGGASSGGSSGAG